MAGIKPASRETFNKDTNDNECKYKTFPDIKKPPMSDTGGSEKKLDYRNMSLGFYTMQIYKLF